MNICLFGTILFFHNTLAIGGTLAPGKSASSQARALVNYATQPLSFEENRGQADASFRFLAHGPNYSILLGTEIELQLQLQANENARHAATVRVAFPGARSATRIIGENRQPALSSYFIGNNPAKWIKGAPNFGRVRYQELYPGIDLAFYGKQGRLEYDFLVSPGADAGAIRMSFDRNARLQVNEAGDLMLSTAAGKICQHQPIVYQESAGVKEMIDARYVLEPDNQIGFAVAHYDRRRPLVIDPVLTFATYLGSSGDELAIGLSTAASQATIPSSAVDPQGNIYVTGYNGGTAASFTGHPNQLSGGSNVFLVKLSPAGSLLYAAVFGGGGDAGGGVAVDSSGNAYVTGFTSSLNFPVTAGAPQSANDGFYNAFVTKVNSTGTALVYSTYLGGSGNFWGRAIAVDPSGNAYVTGTAAASGSTPFPLVNPLSGTPSGGFLTEINAAGTALEYSTYLSPGTGYGIAVDGAGNAYVTGTTAATLPSQGYVLKVNAGGRSTAYGPVLLGSTAQQTAGFGIAIDSLSNAYIAGMTTDPGFPVTPGAAQGAFGGGITDGFAAKLNSGGGVVYATYLGGIGSNIIPERASGITVDPQGNAYVSGTTECVGFPTVNPISGARNGGPAPLMVATAGNWAPATLSGTFDEVTALAFDANGNVYAGTGAYNAAGGGVYKMSAGVWSAATTGITTTTIDALAVDPAGPVYAAGGQLLFKSTNGGGNWSLLANASVGTSAALAVAASQSATTVYVGSSHGLSYSTNGGTSWSVPTAPPGTGAVTAFAVNPLNPSNVYAATPTGVYQTVNAGSGWTAFNTGLPQIGGVTLSVTGLAASSLGVLYAVTPNGLFYFRIGSSTMWTQVVLGQINSTPRLVTVDNATNDVYVAFSGAGAAVGTNGGTDQSDWTVIPYGANGLMHNQIYALGTPPAGGAVYAGTIAATDAFLTEISSTGQAFLTSTCIGGADNNLGQSVALSPAGSIYEAGATVATNFPATSGALQTANASPGLFDDFVMAVTNSNTTTTAATITSSPAGAAITVTGAGCAAGSYTTPANLTWSIGECEVTFTDPQNIAGVEYALQSTSVNGSAPTHTNPLFIVSSGGSLTVNAIYSVTSGTSPGTATHFSVSAPTTATAGVPIQFTVTALDAGNNIASSYTDPVHFSSTDPLATLPGDSTLTNGVGTFSASLATAGTITLTATDLLVSGITGTSGGITVSRSSAGLLFTSMPPCRIVDTRDSTKPAGFGPPFISGGSTRSFTIPSGPCTGIPANAQAYALNVTVVPHEDLGFLTVWPSGQPQPFVSTLNSYDGEVKANAVIVAAGAAGAVSVFATDDTDVVLDINGYFVPNSDSSALAFFPMTPCRLVDTRPGVDPSTLVSGTLAALSTTTLPITSSSCGVPATAQAYSLNFTLVPPGTPVGYLTVWPTGQGQPFVSTLNDPTGTVEANAAIEPAGSGGSINVFVTSTTDLLVDINGYFAPASTGGGLSLYALSPCRVLDTRNPAGAQPFTGALNVDVIGAGCGGTSAAEGYVFNATVVPPGFMGFLSLWPEGQPQPVVSTLNAYNGEVTSNMAIVPTLNTQISAFASQSTYLILDLFGYFAP